MTDGTLVTLVSLLSVVLFLVGVPIFLTIGVWLVGVSWIIGFTLSNIGAAFTDTFTTTFALLALPLFVLTGDLINASGIAKRLANFAYSCLGWLRGGLAMATLGACGLFAAISGSNSATTATIGSIMHPELVKNGYDTRFAAATTAAGGTVGIIIPPSIIFIVYGFIMNVPIAELFIAGIIPGAMMVLAMMGVACYYSWKNGWGKLLALSIRRFVLTAVGAWMGFAAIGLVLYGIYEGAFSPTEAASVTASVALIIALICYPISNIIGRSKFETAFDEGRASDPETRPNAKGVLATLGYMLVVRGFSIREVPDIVLRSAQITGILAPLIAVSIVMQQVLSLLGANAALTEFMSTFGTYYAVLFVSMFIVLLAGTVLESLPNTIILAPILAPIAVSYGVDPIHFGVVFLIGDAIGFITPPYGLNLYVASGVTGIPYFRLLAYTVPYLISLLIVWFIVALFPSFSLALLTGIGG
ncbi:MAG: TRAP transporter large permease [Pseudomonadota bacterium]